MPSSWGKILKELTPPSCQKTDRSWPTELDFSPMGEEENESVVSKMPQQSGGTETEHKLNLQVSFHINTCSLQFFLRIAQIIFLHANRLCLPLLKTSLPHNKMQSCTVVYKSLQDLAPACLSNLLSSYLSLTL